MHSNQRLAVNRPEDGESRSQLDLYRTVIKQQNIGLMISSKSEYRPLNSVMDVLIELYGRDLFLPCGSDNWQVEFQSDTEEYRHFDLSLIHLSEGENLIVVADVTDNVLKMQSANRLLKEACHNATHDHLTGLANRAYLREYAKQTLLEAKRNLERFAVFVLDLDEFKSINDTLGHETGDLALRWVAERLHELCRDSDFIARQGGDEFCIIQRNIKVLNNVTGLAEKLVQGLCDTFMTPHGAVPISASIGVAVYPGDGADVETLLQHADKALYESKRVGRNQFQMYSRKFNQQVVKNAAVKTSLFTAFDKNEFQLRYQPIYEVDSGRVMGLEAFVRWVPSASPWSEILLADSDYTGLRCDVFLHLMERMGLGARLFRWVAQAACRDLAQWRQLLGHDRLTVSLNCSLRQLKDSNVLSILNENLDAHGLPQDAIALEMAEDVFDSQETKIQDILERLRASNITVVLDGFACLKARPLLLRQWKPDCVKLDMNGLGNEEDSPCDPELIADLVTMVQKLSGAPIHAGRVESNKQFSALGESGCDAAQGYLLSKSLEAKAVTNFLLQHKTMEAS